MPFSTLLLSGTTVGMTTLALAIATPASAQETYAHKHYRTRAHYRHYTHHYESRQIVVHPKRPRQCGAQLRLGARGGGRQRRGGNRPGRAGSLYRRGRHRGRGPGRSVWRRGGALRLPIHPELLIHRPELPYGAPFAAPFNAAGAVAASPFQAVGGAFGGTPAAPTGY